MTPATSLEIQEKTAALLAGLWKRNLPLIESRLGLLERAGEAAVTGALTEEMRAAAEEVAHKFAGSLGMFGIAQGTEIARELEVVLQPGSQGNGPDLDRIADLVARLRSVLFPET